MKKVLIVILLLIPLIISLTIDISGQIISSAMDITIDEIRIEGKSGEIPDTVKINVTEYLESDKGYFLKAIILPDISKKTNDVVWKSSAPDIAYVTEEQDDNKTATVHFTGEAFGNVKITCSSRKNKNVYDYVEFFVTGDDIFRLTVMQYGETAQKQSYTITEGKEELFRREVIPSAAIEGNTTIWSSSNPSVASVDQNGIVTGISVGTAEISAVINETRTNGESRRHESKVTVNVTANIAAVKNNQITIAADTVDLSKYTAAGVTYAVLSGNGTISGTTLTYGGSVAGDVTVAVTGSTTESIVIHFTKGAKLLTMAGYDTLSRAVWTEKPYAGLNAVEFSFRAVPKNADVNETPTIEYASSDSTILSIDADGRMIANRVGTVTLTASAEGYVPFVLTVEVMQPTEHFTINLDNAADVRGIEGSVVWGNKFVRIDDDGTFSYDYTYQLEIASIEPSDAPRKFTYATSNSAYATVDENGLITFTEEAAGHEVSVYVYARYTYGGTSVRDSYTFNVVDGVNLGLDTIDAETDPNNYWQLRYFMMDAYYFDEATNGYQSCVLHSDVFYPSFGTRYGRTDGRQDEWGNPLEMGCYAININRNIYGNGYKIDARYFVNEYDQLVLKSDGKADFDVELRNLTVSPAYPPENDDDWDNLKELGGYAIRIVNDDLENGWTNDTLTIRYCTIQNAYNSIVNLGGKVYIDGCLVKNTVSAAFVVQSNEASIAETTINNCIVSNTLAPAIIISADIGTKNLPEYGARLTLTGNNYIYNWKRINEVSLSVLSEEALGGIGAIVNRSIDPLFKKVIVDEQFDYVKVKATETGALRSDDYVNLTVLSLGSWYNAEYNVVTYDEEKWDCITCDFAQYGKILNYNEPIMLYSCSKDENGNFNTVPLEEYAAASDEEGNPLWLKRLKGEA